MLVSIITIFVTLLLGILGFVVNTLLQRKNNSIDVITKSRMKRKELTQDIMATFLRYANYDSIKLVVLLNKQNEVIQELYKNHSVLRSLYTYTFSKDVELINGCHKLLSVEVKYLNEFANSNKEIIEKDIDKERKEFEYIFDLYLYTDWSRIKAETVGKRRTGGIKKWMDDYNEAVIWYEKNTSKS